MHWGTEFTLEIDDEQKEALSFLNSLGVDIIVGSHPHTMQKINWYKGENKDTNKYLELPDRIYPIALNRKTGTYNIYVEINHTNNNIGFYTIK